MIDISAMNKAEVLAKLYNSSRAQGISFLQAREGVMSIEEAQKLLDSGETYFDYLHGKVMKVDLSGDQIDPWLYDRDNGKGAAARALGLV